MSNNADAYPLQLRSESTRHAAEPPNWVNTQLGSEGGLYDCGLGKSNAFSRYKQFYLTRPETAQRLAGTVFLLAFHSAQGDIGLHPCVSNIISHCSKDGSKR
jgi:hypothetical protein